MSVFAAVARGRLAAWITVAAAIVIGAGVFGLPRPDNPAAVSTTGLGSEWASARAEQLARQIPSSGTEPAIVVVTRDDAAALSTTDRAAVDALPATLARFAATAPATGGGSGGGAPQVPPQVSPDGKVALVVVPVATSGGVEAVTATVKDMRAALTSLPAGLTVQVTGSPAFTADLSAVFEGADVQLLAVTAGVVALLLLITYRSPILWIVPLLIVAAAEQLTLRLVQVVVPAAGINLQEGAVTGITSVLVFGAATDYALLLIARYREELRREPDRFAAMRTALRRTAEPVLASGGTVVVGVLTLLLSNVETNRALGVACATGVVIAMAAALFVLPAALVLAGRPLFWPFIPRAVPDDPAGQPAEVREGRWWGRLGAAVARRPVPVAALAVVFLAALSAGTLGVRTGLSETEQFRVVPEAVRGAQTLATAFPAGTTQPLSVITSPGSAASVTAAARGVDGVADVRAGRTSGDVAEVQVVLSAEPGTEASGQAVTRVRAAVAQADPKAVVGGPAAATYDVKEANAQDLRLIVPLILVVVGLVLLALLRSVVASLVLVGTVVASFFASLGGAWLLFDHVLGFPALDSGVTLLAFVFLVALGVDYNIFLVTRAREDTVTAGTEAGMLSALRVTGGVITSAGVLLAAVFAVLGVLPLITLTQIGVIVCLGVLLDTLLVRTVLVPALTFVLGDRFWWPSHPAPEDAAGGVDGGSRREHALQP